MAWEAKPQSAWQHHILPHLSPGWIENGKDISDEIKLSRRELFALIVIAESQSSGDTDWLVGYDASDPEPNDGYITDGKLKLQVEHKVVAQMETGEVLQTILSRYEKFAKLGEAYGRGRLFVIQPNKQTRGLVKISDLRDRIAETPCPFDRVLLLHAVATKDDGQTVVLHISQHHPVVQRVASGIRKDFSQVDFDQSDGSVVVQYAGIDLTD